MKDMTLEKIAEAVGGTLHTENMAPGFSADSTLASAVVIDSRQVGPGAVFIATRGEHVDGHSFIGQVSEKGALGVICEEAPSCPSCAYILVKDSFQALEDIAEYYRQRSDIRVVGITGSVGKTSTKEFVASVLSKKFQVLKTAGNFNNEVGLPLTVLRIRDAHQVAVLEMGISDFGEMRRLSKVARPNVCLFTNIGQCHLENLGTRDGVLKAKTEMFDYMDPCGDVCLNGDDDKLITIGGVYWKQPLRFGMDPDWNDIFVTDYQDRGLDGSTARMHIKREGSAEQVFEITIPLPGGHMVYNALAAAAVGTLFGLSTAQIQDGIRDVQPVDGRSHVIRMGGLTLIDDCYNANPVSVRAAIDLLAMTELHGEGRRVAILGDMFELGADEEVLHHEVGAYAAQKGLDVVICVGALSRHMYDGAKGAGGTRTLVCHYQDKAGLQEAVGQIIKKGDVILVKASHGMHFEELLDGLEHLFA